MPSAKPKKQPQAATDPSRNFHIVLTEGERSQRADDVIFDDGAIVFMHHGEIVLVYAPGEWRMVETEQRDDRGTGASLADA